MTTNLQTSPYLREQRSFPSDNLQALTVEIDRSYVDIAQKMNSRTIGLFASSTATITGESWYINAQRQQTIRKMFTFTAAGSIAHGIDTSQIAGFTRIYGTFQDNSGNWWPLPAVDTTNVTNQTSIEVTSTNIVITSGATAPAITSGFVIVEWLSLV